jgi:RNA-directed DNA polymerase
MRPYRHGGMRVESRMTRKVQVRFGGRRLETQVKLCAGRPPYLVVLCGRASQAQAALAALQQELGALGLTLHPDKTRLVDLRQGREGFIFLGCAIRKRRSILRNPRAYYMQRRPSPRAMKRIRQRVHDLTDARHSGAKDVQEIIDALNPVLRGWGNYFRTGNADGAFNRIDNYVHRRIIRWLWRRGGQRTRFRAEKWPSERLWGMGLYRLQGTVRYPAQATPSRPSVSRVRENRMHGLKGGSQNRADTSVPR